ncbi:WD repeat-containing protein jip5 [Penicillium subrubescens]|uniref:WD repeat-containing protein JIP5 n=1 Tax=Penicillium subrubescens TaxID=1316194 RepID=A0A1Q5UG10_9EURO|nr:WD repeat-containing protein jip5 [Penicillium subrubescens]KAJ5891478.1 WD repeat-containing protein jip5 [Penicillium subrubescens]OKP11399.1 WD repeat-containing protein jip5 [Penicillium subrubescens]
MFDTVCSLPLSSDLFTQAIHPKEPVVSVGLAAGHVQTFRLPTEEHDSDDDASTSSGRNGKGHIDTMWRTRRHKGSCRCLGFSVDGEMLYSAGTDGLVKIAKSESGQVENKIAIPLEKSGSIDAPTVIHALSPQTLLLATDSSALHIYDLRIPYSKVSAKPEQSHHPHDDYISSLTPLPASDTSTSGFSKQWITTGGTTLAVTDLRRGVLVRSEDQEEELVSTAFISGLASSGTSRGEKVAVGGSNGVVTLWEKGAWDDQDERIYVGGAEAIETLTAVPDFLGKGKMVAAGLGNGLIKFIRIGQNKVSSEVVHDETDGVVGLGFDVEGRMVSGGGQIVKVWHDAVNTSGGDSIAGEKHMMGDSDDSDDGSDDSDAEERRNANANERKKRKKGKSGRGTGPDVMAFDMD